MKRYQIKTNPEEALRYLGYQGGAPDPMVSRQLSSAITLLEQIAKPACTYRIFDLVRQPSNVASVEVTSHTESIPQKEGILLKGTSILLTGSDAASFLESCDSCIMMAVTIGHRVDEEIRRLQITDMSGAVILDSCASSAVESICAQLESDLEEQFEHRGFFLTDRFSPGYGDLPISLQPDICRALSSEKTIGVSITGGMLLTPTKSVTAFLGIADRPQPKKLSGCSRCRMNATCNYRKAGVTCAE